MDFARAVVREPDVIDAAHYRRRVRGLCVIFPFLFVISAAGVVLLVWSGRFFVTLAQRSNVETLTIAFFLFFFTYFVFLTAKGAWGAVQVAAYHLRALMSRDADGVERAKIAALGKTRTGPSAALNVIVERADRPWQPIDLQVADRFGTMGTLRLDGVRVTHLDAHREGSNNLFSYFAYQLALVGGVEPNELDVVEWQSIDSTSFLKYMAQVAAVRAIARRLGEDAAWPRLALTASQCEDLERRLSAVCGALRDEAFLPHWEFTGEHKLPIIPEPLGVLSLSREERRVDPLSSMGVALAVVVFAVALLSWFLLRPPWVPGR